MRDDRRVPLRRRATRRFETRARFGTTASSSRRTTVVIQHDNARAFVADPTVVTLYNRRQAYERRAVCADGDRCDWFAVSPDLLRAALVDRDPAAADAERPIRFTHARADASTYLEQRRLFIDAVDPAGVDALDVEERVVALLDRVLTLAYDDRAPRSHGPRLPVCRRTGGRRQGLDRAARRATPDAGDASPARSTARSFISADRSGARPA